MSSVTSSPPDERSRTVPTNTQVPPAAGIGDRRQPLVRRRRSGLDAHECATAAHRPIVAPGSPCRGRSPVRSYAGSHVDAAVPLRDGSGVAARRAVVPRAPTGDEQLVGAGPVGARAPARRGRRGGGRQAIPDPRRRPAPAIEDALRLAELQVVDFTGLEPASDVCSGRARASRRLDRERDGGLRAPRRGRGDSLAAGSLERAMVDRPPLEDEQADALAALGIGSPRGVDQPARTALAGDPDGAGLRVPRGPRARGP